jgi:hypothetical protein
MTAADVVYADQGEGGGGATGHYFGGQDNGA